MSQARRGEEQQCREGKCDEEVTFGQTHRQEERGEQPTLRLGLPGDTGNELAAGQTITDRRTGRAAAQSQATTDVGTKPDEGLSRINCHESTTNLSENAIDIDERTCGGSQCAPSRSSMD